ncbi:TMEM175 family protein [Weeksellaceae bacterium KMM 9713]|uniref:TMEM175 family protein n=1 Tax=Profundicola chukchiensis TaxID=2961959 RepID=A0A9X4MYP7_9FLAO|nr:TMEM175 family protein [Profundicola chukchiensis]MDG4946030.1 TMEM175 family protein [Profundicola chukchiensis]
MKTSRLEAFSDGVLAIIITIMVLELGAPEEVTLNALLVRLPVFVSYLFSFIYIGIYWNNHHHLFQITQRVNGKILWANLHLLFWLSLIPFTTAWIGINYNEKLPVIAYGVILLFCAIAYFILQAQIIKYHEDDFPLKRVVGSDRKGKISIVCYSLGVAFSFINTWIALALYAIVAIMWLVPDRRLEESI